MPISYEIAKQIAEKHRDVTPETVIRIVEMRLKGSSFREIENNLGKDKDTVYRIWLEVGEKLELNIPPEENKELKELAARIEDKKAKVAEREQTDRMEEELVFLRIKNERQELVGQIFAEEAMPFLNCPKLAGCLRGAAIVQGVTFQIFLENPEWYQRQKLCEDLNIKPKGHLDEMRFLRMEIREIVKAMFRSADRWLDFGRDYDFWFYVVKARPPPELSFAEACGQVFRLYIQEHQITQDFDEIERATSGISEALSMYRDIMREDMEASWIHHLDVSERADVENAFIRELVREKRKLAGEPDPVGIAARRWWKEERREPKNRVSM